MKALLVRVGIDSSYGKWNAPMDPYSKDFIYLPIPEEKRSHAYLKRHYTESLPALTLFCEKYSINLLNDLKFPSPLQGAVMHLDPDFHELTCGDNGARRGAELSRMKAGDIIVFYAGLRPIRSCEHKLVYAIVGLYIVDEVIVAAEVNKKRWYQNAHTRRVKHQGSEVVARAKKNVSGRCEHCIPIGEWREGSYRVRKDILNKWGGLSVKNGYIQRSGVPPQFNHPKQFYNWFLKQNVRLIKSNN
jgi:hypothetical protein